MAGVLVVAGPGMLRLRVGKRGRSVMRMGRLAMLMCNTRGGRHWFGLIVVSRALRLISMRSMLTRHFVTLFVIGRTSLSSASVAAFAAVSSRRSYGDRCYA
jgi:hypothetical protein